MFILFGFVSMFMLVMCLAGAFTAMFCEGFSIARNSIWAASSAVKSFVLPKQQKKRCWKQRNHRACYQRFQRRHLPYCLMQRSRTRQVDSALWGPRVRQHWHWRRRTTRYKVRYKVKCSRQCLNEFLTPLQSGREVWNRRRHVDVGFLLAPTAPFLPHVDHGCIPEEVLDDFVCNCGRTFLAAPKLMERFGTISLEDGAQQTVCRLNTCQVLLDMGQGAPRKCQTFKSCPLVWDMGALFGLTPFCQDFIDYTECSIPVNDIARTNTVIGIGTTLHKFKVDGEDIFMACLSYHLPSADERLFSPQTFHTLYGGHSAVFGDSVQMFIDSLQINISIDKEFSNFPMVHDCWVSPQEMKEHGSCIKSALPQYERMVDFLGG